MIEEVSGPFESGQHILGSLEERNPYTNGTNYSSLLTVYLQPIYRHIKALPLDDKI